MLFYHLLVVLRELCFLLVILPIARSGRHQICWGIKVKRPSIIGLAYLDDCGFLWNSVSMSSSFLTISTFLLTDLSSVDILFCSLETCTFIWQGTHDFTSIILGVEGRLEVQVWCGV